MKNNFDRTKTATARFSTRAIAMMLFFVMLLTAIGSGSVLSVIATETNGGVSADALQTAADKALGIAEDALNVSDDNEIVRDKGDLADTGANADIAEVSYSDSDAKVHGSWDNTDHEINGGYSVDLLANTSYTFYFQAVNDWFATSTTISDSIKNYYFSRDDKQEKQMTLKTTVAGTYVFKFDGYEGGNRAMQVDITFPVDTRPVTWTVVGSNTAIFGDTWEPTTAANHMTENDGVWTWTKSNVYVTAGNIEYKIAKYDSWDVTVPSGDNAVYNNATAGYYDVTITYTESTGVVLMSFSVAQKYELTVGTVEHASVTASYGSQTVQEGGKITQIPAGAQITVK